MKDKSQWKWYGHAGHLCVAQWCRFHLCTLVGEYLVSTVGEYLPDAGVREIFARTRGVTLVGEGDFRIADYMEKIGFESIGCGTEKYETMVFKATGKFCDTPECGCGMPVVDWSELDSGRYNTAGDATIGHMEMCDKFSAFIDQVVMQEAIDLTRSVLKKQW